jgi:hypothetical protein
MNRFPASAKRFLGATLGIIGGLALALVATCSVAFAVLTVRAALQDREYAGVLKLIPIAAVIGGLLGLVSFLVMRAGYRICRQSNF